MDLNNLTALVGSLGFPIVACGVLFWYLNKERETHAEEMKVLTEALNSNTKIITEVKVLIETIQREINKNDPA